jgi:hypothetical protein
VILLDGTRHAGRAPAEFERPVGVRAPAIHVVEHIGPAEARVGLRIVRVDPDRMLELIDRRLEFGESLFLAVEEFAAAKKMVIGPQRASSRAPRRPGDASPPQSQHFSAWSRARAGEGAHKLSGRDARAAHPIKG